MRQLLAYPVTTPKILMMDAHKDSEKVRDSEPVDNMPTEEILPISKKILPIIALNENSWDDKHQKEIYHLALKNALNADSVFDIAISGPYGAGKSFVISTFFNQEEYQKETIYVSLGTFKPYQERSEKTETKKTREPADSKKEKEYVLGGEDERQEIEKAILQQLIYHVTPDRTPSSRILRIAKIPKEKRHNAIRDLFISLLCLIIIIKPNSFNYPDYEYFKIFYFVIQLVAVIILLYHVSKVLFSIFGSVKDIKISRLGTNFANIDFSSGNSGSIFNRHLDEILHFFECTQYKYVVIEDLDRFNDIEIFTRLRSLNKAINNYPSIVGDDDGDKRKVCFIYAVKDDLFTKDSRDRTKFFDVIIPIIPIISYNNSEAKINKILTDVDLIGDFDPSFIWEVSTYLNDMRQVKNIVNEYMVYKHLLPHALEKRRLFSVMVYKNLEPLDFSLFYNRDGSLYALQNLRPVLLPKSREKLEEEKKTLTEKLASLKKEMLTDVEELNRIYISRALNLLSVNNNKVVRVYNQQVNLDDLINPANFDKYYLSKHYYDAKGGGQVSIHVDELDSRFGKPNQYYTRKSLIAQKYEIDSIKDRIDALDRQIMDLEVIPLKSILKVLGYTGGSMESIVGKNLPDDNLKILKAIDNSSPLLKHLIISGHLDDSMHSYLAYFHSDGVSERDNVFLRYLFSGGSTEKPTQLDNTGYLLKKLGLEHYDRPPILHPQLVKELTKNRKSFLKQYYKVVKLINSDNKHLSLFDGFKGEQDYSPLIADLAKQKDTFWDDLAGRPEEELASFFKTIAYDLNVEQVAVLNKSGSLKKWLVGIKRIGLVFEADKFSALQCVIEKLGIQFENLTDLPDVDNSVWNHLYSNNFYAMNPRMVEQIIAASNPGEREDNLLRADKGNYTTIKDLDLQNLVNYINDHPQLYLENVSLALSNNTSESEETILHFVNHPDVGDDAKKKFVSKQKLSITKLSDVKDEFLALVFAVEGFALNWRNYLYYFKINGIDENLIGLFNSPKVTKAKSFLVTNLDQSEWHELTDLLLAILVKEELELLSFQKLLTILPDPTRLVDILIALKDNERRNYILENRDIPIKEETVALLEGADVVFFVGFLGKYASQLRKAGFTKQSWEAIISNSDVISKKEKEDLIHELFHVVDDDIGDDDNEGI
ncbi:hypothetical protein ACFQRK_09370 [Parapedobacter sp. GCM10030251]|uniref:YobI family P-loop NTPase n=1 Tax=Parapedobacter sp. GCM10030251 TaxID=3273419 RepID=UPI00361EE78E